MIEFGLRCWSLGGQKYTEVCLAFEAWESFSVSVLRWVAPSIARLTQLGQYTFEALFCVVGKLGNFTRPTLIHSTEWCWRALEMRAYLVEAGPMATGDGWVGHGGCKKKITRREESNRRDAERQAYRKFHPCAVARMDAFAIGLSEEICRGEIYKERSAGCAERRAKRGRQPLGGRWKIWLLKDRGHAGGELCGKEVFVTGGVGSRGEGVGTMFEHALGVMVECSGRGDAEVAEHGIGAPASEKFDGVGVNPGAEERGGASRAEAASRKQRGGDTGGRLDGMGRMAESVGDPTRGNVAEAAGLVVGVDRCVSRGVVAE